MEAIEEARRERARRTEISGELRRRLADVTRDLDKLAELYLSGALDLATVERRAVPLRAEQADLETRASETAPVDTDLWRQVQRIGVAGVLGRVREGSIEGQLVFLRAIYDHVELLPERRIIIHPRGLSPIERVLPRYYSEARGVTDVGF